MDFSKFKNAVGSAGKAYIASGKITREHKKIGMGKIVLLIFLGLLLIGVFAGKPPVVPKDTTVSDNYVLREMKNHVQANLKDPESARFGDVWHIRFTDGTHGVCGYVNAKNSFGGYTGEQFFASSGTNVNGLLQLKTVTFNPSKKTIYALCKNPSSDDQAKPKAKAKKG